MPDLTCQFHFEFNHGWLLIKAPGSSQRIRWTPTPLAEKQLRDSWHPILPSNRLLRPFNPVPEAFSINLPLPADTESVIQQKNRSFQTFRATIPLEYVQAVESFGSCHWAFLKMLHLNPPALDLARSTPVLAYALANNADLRLTPADIAETPARAYCRRKQPHIAEWLGFPGTDAVIKLFRKINPESVYPSILRRIPDHSRELLQS